MKEMTAALNSFSLKEDPLKTIRKKDVVIKKIQLMRVRVAGMDIPLKKRFNY